MGALWIATDPLSNGFTIQPFYNPETFNPGLVMSAVSLGVLSFLAITGWAGLALIEAALPAVLAIGVALGLGVLAMYLCAVVMRSFKRMGAQGNLNVVNARGMFAEAYMPIPAHRAGIGKVTLTMQGRFVELDAVTDDGKDIPTGARVVVMGEVDNGTVLVRAARK